MALAFFDFQISKDIKIKMANSIISAETEGGIIVKKISIRPNQVNDLYKNELIDLVFPRTIDF